MSPHGGAFYLRGVLFCIVKNRRSILNTLLNIYYYIKRGSTTTPPREEREEPGSMGQISLAKNLRGDKGDWWGEAIKLILKLPMPEANPVFGGASHIYLHTGHRW